ncbi:hypothetical protein EVAR_48335_1 [Eumeta japonica]|uniref:Uncharacterized protein n=1 Tax=Eumeta variegata TaxID=151549 RepID=A0A4C1YQL6_EUMVA|nr:hypothetical protein EVAR_48335_1 [Eumeta japonica]
MLEEMLRAEAASAMEHWALPNGRLRIQISDIYSFGGTESGSRIDVANKTKSRIESRHRMEDGIENGTMVGIECGIKIRIKSMFGIAIRNGVQHRRVNQYFGFSFTVASEYGLLRCAGKIMHSVFDVQAFLLEHELHKWWSEYNCYGCTNSAIIYRWYGTEDLLLPMPGRLLVGVRTRRIQVGSDPLGEGYFVKSHLLLFQLTRLYPPVGKGVLRSSLGRVVRSVTSRVLVQCYGGINEGPNWRCRTFGEQCAG